MAAQYVADVHDVARSIPPGRVTTYGAIASFLTLGSARMVGWAMNLCVDTESDVPAHRVVNRKGELSGRNAFPTPSTMQDRLEAEGITVTNDRVERFDELFWDPVELLSQ